MTPHLNIHPLTLTVRVIWWYNITRPNYTPGPWTVGRGRTANTILGDGMIIAEVREHIVNPTESNANETLIALAPELREALFEMFAVFYGTAETPKEYAACERASQLIKRTGA